MKTFKLWLVSLLFWLFWFACFCNSSYDSIYWQLVSNKATKQAYLSWWVCFFGVSNTNEYQQDCIINVGFYDLNWVQQFRLSSYTIYCVEEDWYLYWNQTYKCEYRKFLKSDFPGSSCELDTWAILSWYVSESLFNECLSDKLSCQSSISWYNNSLSSCSDSLNTCNTNLNSCLQSNCWDIQWSALYINNIQHLWAPIINIDIPEEINWDYTWDVNSFDINIEWYNVDSDYIAWIINTQSSKPNNQDFNNLVVWVLPLLIPWFVIIMFIYFIFRLIKKIF